MTHLKHVGRVKNTGRPCVVVFREIYNEEGKVVDTDHCLVVETDSLPDAEQYEFMNIVKGVSAQETGNLYEVISRSPLSNGQSTLAWLHGSGRLRKVATNNVLMTPDNNTSIDLDKLNKIIRMQAGGSTEEEINAVMQDDTDQAPRTAQLNDSKPETVTAPADTDGVLDDAAIAKSKLDQAVMFEERAKELKQEAFKLDPTLKPKRKSRTAPKKAAETS